MSTPANVVAFYAQAYWGSAYGVVDQYHPTPHKGLDLGLFHGAVDVPALHDGVVAAAALSSSVGHYVTVQRADGRFDTYAHIVIGVKLGQAVKQGDRLGRQAVTQAEGGTAWKGQHTHLCLSRTRDGWATWGYTNLDPTPGVIAALTNAASSGGTPLLTEMDTSLMRIFYGTNGAGFLQVDGGKLYAFGETILGLDGGQIATLFYRLINSDQAKNGQTGAKPEEFNSVQVAVIQNVLAQTLPTSVALSDADVAKIAAAIKVPAAVPIDYAALAAAVNNDAAKRLAN